MRPDDFDYNEYDKFMSGYYTILAKHLVKWSRIIEYNPRLKRSDQLKFNIRKGIPLPFRAEVSHILENRYNNFFVILKYASQLHVS